MMIRKKLKSFSKKNALKELIFQTTQVIDFIREDSKIDERISIFMTQEKTPNSRGNIYFLLVGVYNCNMIWSVS